IRDRNVTGVQTCALPIYSIIADIRERQWNPDLNDGGKPGAVIYMPPGDYRLRSPIHIDISFLRIQGAGHGFTSSSIRFNVPDAEIGRASCRERGKIAVGR